MNAAKATHDVMNAARNFDIKMIELHSMAFIRPLRFIALGLFATPFTAAIAVEYLKIRIATP